jgi:uncharacterized protein (DUF1501 family)
MTITRRTLLQGLGGGLVAGQLSFLPRLARASSANAYQALVCIFMYGGNDGNNTVVPLDAANYRLYQQYRGRLALTAATGNAPLPLGKTSYGLHPALKKTGQLWNSGNLSVLLNVGTSIEPGLTVADYIADPSGLIDPILKGTNASIDPLFEALDTSIANQLRGVAKLIAQHSQLGAQTQVFYVDIGNFDTHHNQLDAQQMLLSQFDDAVSAFYAATSALGLARNVTTFTMSDFSRTYLPNTTGGTDHAWGNHHFVIGGSVKPQTVVGSLPALNPATGDGPVGPLDVGTEGRWLPEYSVDQYAATLANWAGLSHAEILDVVPNLVNFQAIPYLGFLNPLA